MFKQYWQRRASLLVALVVISACASPPPVPEDQFYRLQAVYADDPLPAPLFKGSIEVDRFVADGLTANRAIVFSKQEDSNLVRAYHYQFWIKPPTVMLRDELIGFLRKSKIADAVVTPEMRVNARYVLAGKINHLERVISKKADLALIDIELSLRDSKNGKLLALKTYRIEEPAENETVSGIVNALNVSLSVIYADFLSALRSL